MRHSLLWYSGRRIGDIPAAIVQALQWIHDPVGTDLALDDIDLVPELLLAACERS